MTKNVQTHLGVFVLMKSNFPDSVNGASQVDGYAIEFSRDTCHDHSLWQYP